MSTNFNKGISLFANANIFCVFIALIYFNINTLYVDEEEKIIAELVSILIINMLMILVNHFSKQITLTILSENKEIFCYDNIDDLEYILHLIYRFSLVLISFLDLTLWINIINRIF